MPPDDEPPVGRWVHSFEEDHDGTCTVGAIGRGDAPERHEGTWRETAPGTITCAAHGQTLRVTRTGSDRLELVNEPDP